MNRFQKLLQNIAIFMIGNAAVKVVLFFTVSVCTYYLSVEQFGQYELITQSINLLLPLAMIGTSESILRYAIDEKVDDSKLITNIAIINFWGFLIILLLTPLAFFFEQWLRFVFIVILIILAQMFFICGQQYAKGSGNNMVFVIGGVIEAVLQLVTTVFALYFLNDKVEGCLLSVLCSFVIASIYIYYKLRLYKYINIKLYDILFVKEILIYSLPLIPNAVCWWMTGTLNRYFINYYLGLYYVGIYAIAAKIPGIITTFTGVILQAWQISAMENEHAINRNVFFSLTMNIYLLAVCSLVAMVIVFIKPVMMLLVAKPYYSAWIYIPILLISNIFLMIANFVGTNYSVAKKTSGAFYTTAIGTLINVVLNIVLIPFIGIKGALIATLLSYISIMIARLYNTRKYIVLSFDKKCVFSNSISLTIILICLYNGNSLIEIINIIVLGIMLFVNYKSLNILHNKIKNDSI